MVGIYCFTNKINNKKYIGQSRDLEARKKAHLRNYNNKNLSTYNGLFYRAIRKYGIDNFEYKILYAKDNIPQEELNSLETFYIKKFNSLENGYNMNAGGRFTSGKKVLDKEQAIKIQKEIANTNKTFESISKEFKVSTSLITQINQGKIWNEVSNYSYPIRKQTQINNIGGSNPNALLSDDLVMKIRESFMSKNLSEIQKEYKNIPFSILKKAVYGVSFKHLPVYKKREKKWFLNGTCIDYPRVEE